MNNNQMKFVLCLLMLTISNLCMYSQSTIYKPDVASQNDKEANILYVELKNGETIVVISVNKTKKESFSFSSKTTLTTKAGIKIPIKRFTIGNGWLEFNKKHRPTNKDYTIYLYFGAIGKGTQSIDIDENYIGGKYWKGISIQFQELKTNNIAIYNDNQTNPKKDDKLEFKSAMQIRNYYASNIMTLDPIEGVYDVEAQVSQTNTSQKNKGTHELYIYKISEGKFGVLENKDIVITRIGDTNAYNITRHYKKEDVTDRVYLINGISFEWNHEIPQSQIIYDAGRMAAGIRVFIKWNAIKTYPTTSMYADVLRKHVEEETKPITWTGTGFALTNNYIVTNYHVVEEAKSISIQGINGLFNNKYGATIVATDKVNDLAILKVNGVNISNANIPYSVKTSTSEVGEEIFVLGYPLTSTMGDEIKLTTGVISSRTGFQGDVSLYQISAPIQPGNSGGPLFDSKGNIIGIVSSKHRGAENVGYAIKASYLRNLMESALSSNILPQSNKISSLNLSGKVKAVKNYVYYITCSSN